MFIYFSFIYLVSVFEKRNKFKVYMIEFQIPFFYFQV